MVENHTPPNSSYTSPTHLYSKQASILQTAKPGMHVPPLHAPGTTSKHISRPPNASYETKCAQPNKPGSTATLHSIQHSTQPNHQQNIKKPSSTWHPLLLLIANSSPNLPLLLPQLTNTSVNSTTNPHNLHLHVQADHDSMTTSTALSAVTTSLTNLQQQLTELKKENASLRNNRLRQPRARRYNGNYCWMHGYRIGNKHTSETCQNKAPGHQDHATRDNTMGGSLANKPDHL